ncbi:MAG: hypothetical protein QXD62_03920 [Candidatus Woesearchaeota archaeon]
MIALKDKPLKEVILRRYEKPSVEIGDRELIRKFCLSLGLLQPGDKRDIIVDILHVLLLAKEPLSISEIKQKCAESRKLHNLSIKGLAESNLRRQLKRLKDLYLIEKIGNAYYMTENLSLEEILNSKIKVFLVDHIFERIVEYARCLDSIKKNV